MHPFIVLEGIDGSGTTTQVEKLAARIRDHIGIEGVVHTTREPTSSRIGALIRRQLRGELEFPFTDNTLALLFAADRLDHIAHGIEPQLKRGPVISDRYLHSSIFYQSLTCKLKSNNLCHDPQTWIHVLNCQALKPTMTIVLDVPEEVAFQRLQSRGGKPELFERRELQAALAIKYVHANTAHHVDGTRTINRVADEVWKLVAPLFEKS